MVNILVKVTDEEIRWFVINVMTALSYDTIV